MTKNLETRVMKNIISPPAPQKRRFLQHTAVIAGGLLSGAATSLATMLRPAPALANPAIIAQPDVQWRLTSSFQPTLPLIYGGARTFSDMVSALTDGHFRIDVIPSGEIAASLDALDAVASGKAELSHTALTFFWDKDPALVYGTCVPFGMNARQHNAWLMEGGGNDLLDESLKALGVVGFPAGNVGAPMGGWFRREINTIADFNGLKLRLGGLTGKIFEKLGATPVALSRAEILPALAEGSLDGVEWIGPYDDERVGVSSDGSTVTPLSKYAPYYYYPGWWRGGFELHVIANAKKYDELPDSFKAALKMASAYTQLSMQAKYDAATPAALKRLVNGGAQLRLFSQELMEQAAKTTNEVMDGLASSNAHFAKVQASYNAFRSDQYLAWQTAEYSFDNFMIRQRRAKG